MFERNQLYLPSPGHNVLAAGTTADRAGFAGTPVDTPMTRE